MGKNHFVSLSLKQDFVLDVHAVCLELQDKINECTNNQIKFLPMYKNDIHMTLCFLGQVLNDDRKTKTVICNNNFEHFKKYFGGNILEFDEFSLFGTHQNLIVAKFKCVNDRNFTNKMIEFKRMFCQIGAKEENYFTPHITLGKINNFVPNQEKINTINKILLEITKIMKSIVIDSCILV